jgi:hypothetical protein
MKYLILLLSFVCLGMLPGTPSEIETDKAYSAGEKLVYKIFYNWNFVWLTAGEVAFEIKDEQTHYHIEVTAKTYSSYEWFYRVRDKYHSYIDKKTGLPKLYIRDIQQGTYRHYEKIVFDYPNRKAISYTGRTMNDLKSTVLELDKDYYDMISCMYFLRGINKDKIISNGPVDFNIILDNEKYTLSLKYVEQEKNLKIKDSGTYNSFRLVADVIAGKVFKSGVQLNFWIGDDSNSLPVMLESPLIVGSAKGVLSSYCNLKYPFSCKIK